MRAIPCETYSRVVGYFSPVRGWNKGKKEEFRERKYYTLPGEDNEPEKPDHNIHGAEIDACR
ncbi:MAG: anaerobic ribonucleoside-triphosphate reductase [Phycisphaerae bacterium]